MRFTDTQLIILSDAAKRDDGIAFLPDRSKGSARAKIIGPLLRAKLLEEMPNPGALPPWRRDDKEGTAYALRITTAGLKAISADEETASGQIEPLDIEASSAAKRSGAADSQGPQPQGDVRSSKRRARSRATPKRQRSKTLKPSKRSAPSGPTHGTAQELQGGRRHQNASPAKGRIPSGDRVRYRMVATHRAGGADRSSQARSFA